MSIADDRIDDAHFGLLWTKHFPKIGVDIGSNTLVLALVYIIEDKAKAASTGSDWSDRVSQQLRQHGIPPDEFWEIHSEASR
jgi:hypothetical protein